MPCPTCNDAGIVEGEACIVAFHPDHPERLRIPHKRGPAIAVMPCATCYPHDETLRNTRLVRR